jgi:hypothetical protein
MSAARRRSTRRTPKRDVDRLYRLAPLVIVGLAVLFNLIALRGETVPVQTANDSEHHLLMIRWAEHRVSEGHLPFDGWYPLNLGSPHFHHYQSFPHIVAGLIATVVDAPTVFTWSLYLLLALWPLCVYWSGRIFGAGTWVSAAAAVLALLVVSVRMNALGFEYAAYTRAGFGVWSQLWGMWFLALALALTWRTVNRDGSYVWPSLALAGLLVSHFITAYLGLLVIGAWVLVCREGFVRRVKRTAVIVGGAVLVGGWGFIPAVFDSKWASRQEGLPDYYLTSFGPGRVLSWLVTGGLFDSGRLPIVTFLVAAGVVVCARRWRDERARALLIVGGVSLVMYMGRSIVGPILDLLPVGAELPLHRAIGGVHLAGVALAGVGAVWILGVLADETLKRLSSEQRRVLDRTSDRFHLRSRELVAAALIVVGLMVLVPAFTERWSFAATSRRAIERRVATDDGEGRDVADLVAIAKREGGGRVYAGMSEGSGEVNDVDGVPVYLLLARNGVDAIGYKERTLSLGQNVEGLMSDANTRHFDLFNIRYVITTSRPFVDAEKIADRGIHSLWRVDTSGYLDVVDTSGTITADRTNLGTAMRHFMLDRRSEDRALPTVAFGNRPAAPPTVDGDVSKKPPGRVVEQAAVPDDGVFVGTVKARRRAVVLLKSSFDPRWRVTVDGKHVEAQMIAPAFIGAPVDKGEHEVRFEYVPLRYGGLFALSALALALLTIVPRLVRKRQRPPVDAR